MKKKVYESPTIDIVKVKSESVICVSGEANDTKASDGQWEYGVGYEWAD